jgi:hypothetical protein
MKYQKAGIPKYWKYSPWTENWKCIEKKKKFHTSDMATDTSEIDLESR